MIWYYSLETLYKHQHQLDQLYALDKLYNLNIICKNMYINLHNSSWQRFINICTKHTKSNMHACTFKSLNQMTVIRPHRQVLPPVFLSHSRASHCKVNCLQHISFCKCDPASRLQWVIGFMGYRIIICLHICWQF